MKGIVIFFLAAISTSLASDTNQLAGICVKYKQSIVELIKTETPEGTSSDAVRIVERLGPPSKEFTSALNAYASTHPQQEVVEILASHLTFSENEKECLEKIGAFLRQHESAQEMKDAYKKWEIALFKS